MFIELHNSSGNSFIISTLHIIRIAPHGEQTLIYLSGANEAASVFSNENYEEVCALLKAAGTKISQAKKPIEISNETLQKAKEKARA